MRVRLLALVRRNIAFLRVPLCLDGMVEVVDLVLQCLDRVAHHTEFAGSGVRCDIRLVCERDLLRLLEAGGATVRGVQAVQLEVSAALARYLAITFNLSSLALITTTTPVLAAVTEHVERRGIPCD